MTYAALFFVSSILLLSGCGVVYQASLTPPRGDEYQKITTSKAATFRFRKERKGAPYVVYIHGKLGALGDLVHSPLFEELSQDFSLYAYDRPGSGHSLERNGWWAWSPDDFAKHLHELLHKEGIEKPILLAHSWGGAVALNYALQYPDSIRGMVLLAPAAYPWPGYFSTSVYDWFISSYILSDIFLQTAFVPLAKILAPIAVEEVFSPQKAPASFKKHVLPLSLQPTAYQRAARDTVELREELKKQAPRYDSISTPTIVLSDEDDRVVPARIHGARLIEVIPNGEIRYLEGVGHHFIYAKPKEIGKAVRDITDATEK